MSQKQRRERQERQARYSLYSTDSEDQVASTHRGLDRCAALLKSLLSPEKSSDVPPQHRPATLRGRPARSPHKTTNVTGTAGKMKKDTRPPKSAQPGASRLRPPHPSSSSEPGARQPPPHPTSSSVPNARHPPPPSSSSLKPTARYPPPPPTSLLKLAASHSPLPPSSSLVPAARHSQTDTKTKGKPPGTVGKPPREAPSNSVNKVNLVTQSRFTDPGKLKSSRRLLIAHRRLKTEPGGKTTKSKVSATTADVRSNQLTDKNTGTSLGNRNRTQTANVMFSATQQPQLQTDDSTSAAHRSAPSDPNPRGIAHSQAPPPSLGYHHPYTVPLLHFAPPYGYYPPFWPYYHPSARFTPPISSHTLHPGSTHPAHQPSSLHSSSLPLLPAQSFTSPSHDLNSGSHPNITCHNPEENAVLQNEANAKHSNKSTPHLGAITRGYDPNIPAGPSHGNSAAKGASEARTAAVREAAGATNSTDSTYGSWQAPMENHEGPQSDVGPGVLLPQTGEAIQLLAKEMLCSVKDSIVRIRGAAGSSSTELLKSLQDLEDTQKSYHERFTALRLARTRDVMGGQIPFLDPATSWVDWNSSPSTADWLAQLQQLESEKSHLLERVVQSEMAYSETKGLLDQAEKKAEQLRKELETQLLSVRSKLQNTSEALTTLRGEKVAVEEELERVRSVEVQLTRQQNAKTVALECQVSSLEQQLSESREELCRSGDRLSATQCALETGKEEKQMVQLSLAEKETELLQAQDRLLGLRQCLAYFLSDIVKLDTPHHYQQHSPLALLHYRVPREAVQRLQSLVSEGNVERFLAAYDHLPRQSGGSPLPSHRVSPTPIDTSSPRLSKSPPGSSYQLSPTHSLQLSPSHSKSDSKGMTSPVPLCANGVSSLNYVDIDSDGSTIVAQDTGTESTEKPEAKPRSKSARKKGSPQQLRTAHEIALSQQSGSEAIHTVLHTAAVKETHTLKDSSPKTTVSSRTGVGAANVASTDLQSVLTTSSEVEFRRDLASLDADIARLQMQFRVAMQRQPALHL